MCYTYSNYYRMHVQKETRHLKKVKLRGLDMVAHALDPSTWKGEAGGSQ